MQLRDGISAQPKDGDLSWEVGDGKAWWLVSPKLLWFQTAEMLKGAAEKLVGIGSDLHSASALARIYIWLLVEPLASIEAAITTQLRISVIIGLIGNVLALSPDWEALREWENRTATEQLSNDTSGKKKANQASEMRRLVNAREVNSKIVKA